MSIADLTVTKPDRLEAIVRIIYGKKPPEYAVYRTEDRVMVMFADEAKNADEQRRKMARLNPLRGEINGLVDGWRTNPKKQARAALYDRRVADALVVGFEDDVAAAEALLKTVKQDILDERIATARFEYLGAAFATGVTAMLLIALVAWWGGYGTDALSLARAAAAGAVGAFFSISLAIRGRTVLPDLQPLANSMDAVLRMVIGVIAASVLMALIVSGIVAVNIGEGTLAERGAGAQGWLLVLLYGFIAGFSERFVPDLLAKASATTVARPAEAAPEPVVVRDAGAATAAVVTDATVELPEKVPEDPVPEEAGTDHCACDIDLPDDEATDDADLPPASGGVAKAA